MVVSHFRFVLLVQLVCTLLAGCGETSFEHSLRSFVIQPHSFERIQDLGQVQSTAVIHEFHIKNSASNSVTITDIRKNCSCTVTNAELGTVIEKDGEISISITITAKPSGGVEVGEVWVETTSTSISMEVSKVRLRLLAEFPKMFRTEVSSVIEGNSQFRLRLYSIEPRVLAKFNAVKVKPEVVELEVVNRIPANGFLEFEFRFIPGEQRDWVNAFAVFTFDDSSVPFHTELIQNPASANRL